MTQTEQQFIIWACVSLLAIMAFIGGLGVHALIKMGRDINEMKVALGQHSVKHDALEERIEKVEHKLKMA